MVKIDFPDVAGLYLEKVFWGSCRGIYSLRPSLLIAKKHVGKGMLAFHPQVSRTVSKVAEMTNSSNSLKVSGLWHVVREVQLSCMRMPDSFKELGYNRTTFY